jgi:hypothetical protein
MNTERQKLSRAALALGVQRPDHTPVLNNVDHANP